MTVRRAPSHLPAGDEPLLSVPYRGAPPLAAVERFVRKGITFSGRASRSEFWWPTLIVLAVSLAIDPGSGLVVAAPDWVSTAFDLLTLVPTLAVTWRRLHDTDRSGSWIFIAFLPVLGWIWLFVLLVSPPAPAGVRRDRSYIVPRTEPSGEKR